MCIRDSLRIELARLNVERFEAIDTAVELLRIVLDDDAGNGDAVVTLSELYEKAHRDEELAELLSAQIEGARQRGDTQAELRFQVRLGEIYDTRIQDRTKAIATYQTVLERDGSHRGALEALARLHPASKQPAAAARVLDRLRAVEHGREARRPRGTPGGVDEAQRANSTAGRPPATGAVAPQSGPAMLWARRLGLSTGAPVAWLLASSAMATMPSATSTSISVKPRAGGRR